MQIKFGARAVSHLKMSGFTSKKAYERLLFYSAASLCCVKERMGPPAACRTNTSFHVTDFFGDKADETTETN